MAIDKIFKKTKISLCVILVLLATGCAFVPTTELKKIPKTDLSKYKCSPVLAKVAVTDGFDFEIDYMSFTDVTKEGNEYQKSNFQTSMILRELEYSNTVKLFSKGNESNEYLIIGFTWNEVRHNWGWGNLTILSLGIIPSKMDYDIIVKAKVFSSRGKLLHSYTASGLKIEQYNGIFLFPFVPWQRVESKNKISETVFPNMINELIEKMITDKVFSCEG